MASTTARRHTSGLLNPPIRGHCVTRNRPALERLQAKLSRKEAVAQLSQRGS